MNVETDFLQADRILRLSTPLGDDTLLAEKLTVQEHVSALFEITVAVRSKLPEIAPDQLLGKPVDVSVELSQQPPMRRTWNAIVTDLIAGPRASRGLRSYQLVLRPALWMLAQKSDCRIWLDKSAIEVAEILCAEHGLPMPVTAGVIDPVSRQHYSTQWNESDLDYLMRRLQEDGLFFFWRHEEGAHALHIASHSAGYLTALEDDSDVRFAAGSTDRNHINRFETTFRYIPGSHAGRDWNFTTPGTVPGGATPGLVKLPKNGGYERYEYPVQAGYGTGTQASEGIDNAEVERVSKLRMQTLEAEHARVEGGGTVRTLSPGHRFTPYDVADPGSTFDPHVVLSITHEVVDTSYESVGNQPEYVNRFLALPANVPATPQRTVPQPRIDGTQVAIVAGPEGEEIHPDEYGRIKLWFPWDRRAKKDGSDTCWVRVSQNWAGAGWGGQVIPRVGMEVMVTYLDGDPDRPVVTGVVPNARQKVPYELPGNKTKTVMRSQTHKGDGFNEITFEDQNGTENMFFHAQKDQTTRVLNDRTKRIDRHEVSAIGQNRAVEVGGNQKHEVGGSMNTVVGGTGVSALALMSSVQGLAGHTAGLLQQAGEVAGQGGNPAMLGFAGTLASSALGFLGAGGLTSRSGVVGGDSNRPDAGRALGDAGSGVGSAAASLFPMPGVMNTIVGSFKSDTIGIARAEQIGTSKVTNVGSTSLESVGKYKKIAVGEEFVIECGDSKFIMKSNGEILILGKTFNFVATDHFQMRGKPIDMN